MAIKTKKPTSSFSVSAKPEQDRGATFSERQSSSFSVKRGSGPIAKDLISKAKVQLGTWEATAICGNDITSSCLYVAAISAAYAGALAPICLLMVAGVLYLYRDVYAEVGDALPLNGGAYNCLLNTTTKAKASIAACMTVLSYIATAVISAKTSMEYVHAIVDWVPVTEGTILLLGAFALLTILGIGESAKTALVIFVFHLVTLSLFVVGGAIYVLSDTTVFVQNWQVPQAHNVGLSLFFGFSVALLGVSGFESSANFIEEQKPGVFPKTLRNMWLAVSIFNPLIAAIALGVLPLDEMIHNKEFMLLDAARSMTGETGAYILAVDAALVLSGAVLASFVGVTGLVTRMTLDRCLPQFLLKINRRNTNHRIVLLFFALCVSIFLMTRGDLLILAGVYTVSFLSVMSLFALGNILLKVRRAKLPRKHQASWPSVFLALVFTLAGIGGYIYLRPEYLRYFSAYFFPTVGVVLVTLYRHHILDFVLLVLKEMARSLEVFHQNTRMRINRKIKELRSSGVIFFTKGDDVASLNRAMLYVLNNEISRRITVVHVLDGMEEPPPRLVSDLKLLAEIYPELEIEFVVKRGKFSPKLIGKLSEEFQIAPNYMFIGTPGDHFPHRLADLGGVRVII